MTTLYRIYGTVDERNKEGFGSIGTRLLYVGITDHFDHRLASHSEKAWFKDIKKVTRQEFDSRDSAAIAEREAIKSERPIRNRVHNADKPPATAISAPVKPHKVRSEWLSQQQAAEYLGVTDRTIRNYIARGVLPASRIRSSRVIRIKRSDIDELLQPVPNARY